MAMHCQKSLVVKYAQVNYICGSQNCCVSSESVRADKQYVRRTFSDPKCAEVALFFCVLAICKEERLLSVGSMIAVLFRSMSAKCSAATTLMSYSPALAVLQLSLHEEAARCCTSSSISLIFCMTDMVPYC